MTTRPNPTRAAANQIASIIWSAEHRLACIADFEDDPRRSEISAQSIKNKLGRVAFKNAAARDVRTALAARRDEIVDVSPVFIREFAEALAEVLSADELGLLFWTIYEGIDQGRGLWETAITVDPWIAPQNSDVEYAVADSLSDFFERGKDGSFRRTGEAR